MLFTDKIPGILDLHGAPKLNPTPGFLKRTVAFRKLLEYRNGVNGDDGYIYGGSDSAMVILPKGPTGRVAILDKSFQFVRFIPELDAFNIEFAIRIDNDDWVFTAFTGQVMRLNIATGVFNSTFATNAGVGYGGFFRVVKRWGDHIYISGSSGAWAGTTTYMKLFRISLLGAMDTSWVIGHNNEVTALERLSDGRFVGMRSYTTSALFRLNENGTLDSGFNVAAPSGSYGRGSLTRPDGSLVFTGDFTSVGGLTRRDIFALDPYSATGTVLSDYGTGLINYANATSAGNTPRIYSPIYCPNGDIICTGLFLTQEGTSNQVSACRIRTDGSMNPNFRFRGVDWATNWSCNLSWAKPVNILGRDLIFVRSSNGPAYANGYKVWNQFIMTYDGVIQRY